MPKRTDIKSILMIGSGPIVIGQACEFDYSGTQAVKALREEGYRVILVNSNPATIMTDPDVADRTYIEPIVAETIESIIAAERPDAVLPTMGGQTALNCALELAEAGVFEKYGCELIGASIESIKTAEDRDLFRQAMDEIGLESAKSILVRTAAEADDAAKIMGFPLVLRPSRTLGGTGGGIVYQPEDLADKIAIALQASPNSEVLIEESLVGWKEVELEVMRDTAGNCVVVCPIENLDPMGVHTGDSITVAPLMTITDKEYQLLRDAAIAVMRRIGVDTGGSNVQFALNPKDGRVIVIEMNPRVSRSSALASKATGFPIAKIAAKLAVGYHLDELKNDITKETPACFEPSIDYVVVKIPRFNFEKFPSADSTLGTQMKSVGEVLSFGRTFREALQKALSSLELDSYGFDRAAVCRTKDGREMSLDEIVIASQRPAPERIWLVAEALRRGATVELLFERTGIDPWFLAEMEEIVTQEQQIAQNGLSPVILKKAKRDGFSDRRLAQLCTTTETTIRQLRTEHEILPNYKAVDTCAGEFFSPTPYLYGTYDGQPSEILKAGAKERVIILGSGPNRIGQGIEFDYCCVHGVMAVREAGYEAIMINCNPETVSTDYDISDRLYFEPLTLESVLAIVRREQPKGVVVQFGGQTPLKLAAELKAAGVPLLGTSVDSIDMAEDRERFSSFLKERGLLQPEARTARSLAEAQVAAAELGFPLMIRPSFVLGGRSMRVLYSMHELQLYMTESVQVSHDRPVLLDRFLEDAIEVDVDAVGDGNDIIVAGIMEHIERAGIHSGDSSCCIPAPTLSADVIAEITTMTKTIGRALNVIGLMNIQYAITRDQKVYVIEVNPRGSRTVPFVSKASGVSWAKVAMRLMLGASLVESGAREVDLSRSGFSAIKACVFPFSKFTGVDSILGPEMRSTGEVMGLSSSFGAGFAKSQFAAGQKLPVAGRAFLSVMKNDKPALVGVAARLISAGFEVIATTGTANFLRAEGITVTTVKKVREGSPHIVDQILNGSVSLVINTPEGAGPYLDSQSIRIAANKKKVSTYTTIAAADAAVQAIVKIQKGEHLAVMALQDYHVQLAQQQGIKENSSGKSMDDQSCFGLRGLQDGSICRGV